MTEEPPSHQLPQGELGPEEQCRFCPEQVRFGKTVKGNRAPFDAQPPHLNHWISCQGRVRARKAYPRGRNHPQNRRRGS